MAVLLVVLIMNIKSIVKYFFPLKYEEYIVKYSEKYNLDPYLVAAVIKTESNFNERAESNKDAYGLMQIIPDTAQWVAEKMEINNFKTQMYII